MRSLEHIRYKFHERKATQVAAQLIKLNNGTENYTKLIKLLYLLDRTALIRWGFPLTWDKLVSMPHGPVVSSIYDLIAMQPDPAQPRLWHKHIFRDGYNVRLDNDPGDGELNEDELALISEIWNEHKSRNYGEMIDFCHDPGNVPEWKDPQGNSADIWPETILKNAGWDAEDIQSNAAELRYFGQMREDRECA